MIALRHHCLLYRNAARQAASDRPVVEAHPSAGLFKRHHFIVHKHFHRALLIKNLLSSRRPTAVLRRVVAVRVNTVDTESGGRLPHFGEESVVALPPCGANVNSACSVSAPTAGRWIRASRNHASVNAVRAVRHAVSGTGISTGRLTPSVMAVATSRRPTAAEMDEAHRSFTAAAASALDQSDAPAAISALKRGNLAKHSPFAELLSGFDRDGMGARHRVHHTNLTTDAQDNDGVTVLKPPKARQ